MYNYLELRKVLEDSLKHYTVNESATPDMRVHINRGLLNLLSSMRTFLDHSEFNLKKRYGDESEQFKHFKKACSAAYDGDFSYRFIYRLRNYAQHCALPLGRLEIGSKLNEMTEIPFHYLKVFFDRDQLLNSFDDWGNQLESELKGMPAFFEINPHVDVMMQDLGAIHETLLIDHMSDLLEDATRIRMILEPTKGKTGTPCILVHEGDLVRKPGEKLHLTIEWMPLHVLDALPGSTRHMAQNNEKSSNCHT